MKSLLQSNRRGRSPAPGIARVTVGALAAMLLVSIRAGADDTWTKVVGNSVMPIGDGGATNVNVRCVSALASYNGFLYAVASLDGSSTGDAPSVWRTSDMVNWTNVASGFICTDRGTKGQVIREPQRPTLNAER